METNTQLEEARMSAAVKLQRAFEREQQKSEASRKRGEELLKQNKQQDSKQQQANEETLDQSADRKKQLKRFKDMAASSKLTEGTIQPSGTDKIDVAGNEVPAGKTKEKTVKQFKFFTQESWTFDSAAMAKQELADAKNKKHRKRGKVANLLRKLGMKEETQVDEAYGRKDAYTRDYESSTSGMGKHQSAAYRADGGANDEGHAPEKFKPKSTMDRPHSVHIGGKKWKTFDNGHQAHAAANTLKKKGKDAVAIAHYKEETEMNEGVLDKVKAVGKKALETLGHGSDEQLRKDLQKKVGVPQTGQKPKKLREFIEGLKEGKVAKEVNVDKVHAAGDEPHEEKWEDAKKVKKESFTADELLQALKEGLWPGTPEHKAKFGDKYAQKQGGGAGVKKGTRYGGSAQKADVEDDNDADDKPAKKNK